MKHKLDHNTFNASKSENTSSDDHGAEGPLSQHRKRLIKPQHAELQKPFCPSRAMQAD